MEEERLSPKKLQPFERIIFPLDLADPEQAIKYVRLLKDAVGVFKVGLELFTACGPEIVKRIQEEAPSQKIFLDIKFHDIPETVKRAIRVCSTLGVDFLTVHCSEGSRGLMAVAEAKGNIKVLGVTVLTSMSKDDLKEIGIDIELAEPEKLVLKRAELAKRAGLDGIVCSGLEVSKVKEKLGEDFLAVTPGIRLLDKTIPQDDQKRIVTPFDAIVNGADYIVVGRPIRDAEEPRKIASLIAEEIQKAEKYRLTHKVH